MLITRYIYTISLLQCLGEVVGLESVPGISASSERLGEPDRHLGRYTRPSG